MAAVPMSFTIGSDEVKDFICSICIQQMDADFYCEKCLNFYCGKCIKKHNKIQNKHPHYGRNEINKWPVSKNVEKLLKCEAHNDENVTLFCDDHNQLCCIKCAIINHSHCDRVKDISEELKTAEVADLQPMSVNLQNILDKLKSFQKEQEDSFKSVKGSYDEPLQQVRETRRQINEELDKIERNTTKEMIERVTRLEYSLKSDVENCTRLQNELKRHQEAIQEIIAKDKRELSFITSKQCSVIMQKSELFLKDNFKISINFQPNREILDFLSKLSGLGKIDTTQTLLLQESVEQGKHIESAFESSTNEDLRRLFEILEIDTMAECRTVLFPAFRHGCGASQGIATRGTSFLDEPIFNEAESQIVYQDVIQLYTKSILMDKIKALNKRPEHLVPVKQLRLKKQNISFPALVAVEKEQHDKIKHWISNLNRDITGLGLLLVGEDKETTYIAPRFGVFQSMTIMSDIMVAADNLLERTVFAVLKNLLDKCVTKYGESISTPDYDKEDTLQSIYTYARTAYKRSVVPISERLTLPEITFRYPKNIDDIINGLLKIEGVIGCSKNIGQIEVLVDNSAGSEETTRRVNQILKSFEEDESVKAIIIYGRLTNFLSSGDSVFNGTLGGFAQRFSSGKAIEFKNKTNTVDTSGADYKPTSEQLIHEHTAGTAGHDHTAGESCTKHTVETSGNEHTAGDLGCENVAGKSSHEHSDGILTALISRHVAIANREDECLYLRVDGNVIAEIKKIQHEPLIDIIPLNVYERFREHCNTKFKTEDGGQLMNGNLLRRDQYKNDWIGGPVYLWGAKTKPGLGTLAKIDFETTSGLWIKVHDRIKDQPFSQPGDSGAMVCATDSKETTLYAVAMLVGKSEGISSNDPSVEQVTYYAVLLNEAFQVLNNVYRSEFKLCGDDA